MGGGGNQESLDYGFYSEPSSKEASLSCEYCMFPCFPLNCKFLFHRTYVLLFSTLGKDALFTFMPSLSHAVNGCIKQLCGNCWSQCTEGVKNIPLLSYSLGSLPSLHSISRDYHLSSQSKRVSRIPFEMSRMWFSTALLQLLVATGDMQPFSLMPEEVPNLQPCTLHLYYNSPLAKACWYAKSESAQSGSRPLSLHRLNAIFYLGI